MTDTTAIRELGFEFAQLLADDEFRRALRKAGGRKRRDVIVANDGDPFDSVMRRAIKQTRPPVVLFVKRPRGYTLIRLELKPWWARMLQRHMKAAPLRISPAATMGMVCDALAARDRGVAPERWSWFRLRPVDDHVLAH